MTTKYTFTEVRCLLLEDVKLQEVSQTFKKFQVSIFSLIQPLVLPVYYLSTLFVECVVRKQFP